VGATSICGGLSEVCSAFNRKVLLWDLDTASRDLSRSLAVTGVESAVISSWVNGSREITRESLKDALVVISEEASVLMPPDSIAESIDLVCHTDGILIAQRIVELTKSLFDVVFVDTGGVMGPAMGSLLRLADIVVVVIDDGILGLTAVDLFLTFVKALVGSVDKIVFVVNSYSGTLLAVPQIASELEPAHHLGAAPWRLPPVPYDQIAASWPGSGRTLYSKGGRQLRESLEDICVGIGLIDEKMVPRRESHEAHGGRGQAGLLNRLLGKRVGGQGRSS
jgi:MinD-like ATPase involved in chromosome partitioning or flagellar assembly